jgi:ABC-type uncharacterized transport system substrate-binding protein
MVGAMASSSLGAMTVAAVAAAMLLAPTAMSGVRAQPVAVTLTVRFDTEGRLAALRETWTFDEEYSAKLRAALDADGDGGLDTSEMAAVAVGELAWIARGDYFTRITQGSTVLPHLPVNDLTGAFATGRFSASFTLRLATPPALSAERIEVSDRDGMVDFVFGYPDVLAEGSPSYCRVGRGATTPPTVDVDCR